MVTTYMSTGGTNLNMYMCQSYSSTDQRWQIEWSSFDDCAFRIRNKATRLCVDSPGMWFLIRNLVLETKVGVFNDFLISYGFSDSCLLTIIALASVHGP